MPKRIPIEIKCKRKIDYLEKQENKLLNKIHKHKEIHMETLKKFNEKIKEKQDNIKLMEDILNNKTEELS